MNCTHEHFDAKVTTIRSDHEPVTFNMVVTIKCTECDTPFRFERTHVSSTDGLELTAQIKAGARKVNRPLKAA